jgi:hypothetical protein
LLKTEQIAKEKRKALEVKSAGTQHRRPRGRCCKKRVLLLLLLLVVVAKGKLICYRADCQGEARSARREMTRAQERSTAIRAERVPTFSNP